MQHKCCVAKQCCSIYNAGMTIKPELLDPRIARTRSVVIAAAMELVSECGFGRATIEGIAEKSGVARSTIYRHWDSLAEILHDAMVETVSAHGDVDTGTLRGDLIEIYTHLGEHLSSPTLGHIVVSMFAEARRDPKVAELLNRFSTRRKQRVVDAIEAAKSRRTLPASVDSAVMAEDLVAPVFFRAIVMIAPFDHVFIENHVDRWLDHYGYQPGE